MVQIKKEKLERDQRRNLALRDESMLPEFIRLLDYLMIESLVNVSHSSMYYFHDEMNKSRNGKGLFSTIVYFNDPDKEGEAMSYNPPENDLLQRLENMLDEMVKTVNIQRISGHAIMKTL